jgi:hypothetical protein
MNRSRSGNAGEGGGSDIVGNCWSGLYTIWAGVALVVDMAWKDNQEVHHKVSDEQRNIHYWLVESVLIVVWYWQAVDFVFVWSRN